MVCLVHRSHIYTHFLLVVIIEVQWLILARQRCLLTCSSDGAPWRRLLVIRSTALYLEAILAVLIQTCRLSVYCLIVDIESLLGRWLGV